MYSNLLIFGTKLNMSIKIKIKLDFEYVSIITKCFWLYKSYVTSPCLNKRKGNIHSSAYTRFLYVCFVGITATNLPFVLYIPEGLAHNFGDSPCNHMTTGHYYLAPVKSTNPVRNR